MVYDGKNAPLYPNDISIQDCGCDGGLWRCLYVSRTAVIGNPSTDPEVIVPEIKEMWDKGFANPQV